MIWLRDEDLSALAALKVDITFAIDNLIYVIGDKSGEPWSMYSIDADTLSIKEVPVICHEFALNPGYNAEITMYKGAAYIWDDGQKTVLVGTVEDDGFHWRIVETTGPKPRFSWGSVAGNTENKYVMLVADNFSIPEEEEEEWSDDDMFYKCELDLDTMAWTRTETIKKEGSEVVSFSLQFLATPGCIHAFHNRAEAHIFMDRVTEEWSLASSSGRSDSLLSPVFVVRGNVYRIGCHPIGDNHAVVVHRFEEGIKAWKIVFAWPSEKINLSMQKCKVVVIGSRINIICAKSRNRFSSNRLDHMMVFDLDPSLFGRSLSVVLRDESLKDLAAQRLPPRLAAKLHRDTTGDSLVPVYDGGASEDAFQKDLFDFGSFQRAIKNINVNDFLERDESDD